MPVGTRSARLVLVIAALASIATSAPPAWTLEQSASIAVLTLDDAEPTRAFAIQSVLSCRDELDVEQDVVQVHLELRGRDVTSGRNAEVIITFASDARPLEPEHRVVIVPASGVAFVDVSLPAWTDCASARCIEDYTLTIRRSTFGQDPIVDISGEILIDASGDGTETPPRTLLELDVTDLGPAL